MIDIEVMPEGTDLFKSIMVWAHAAGKDTENLMKQVWYPTPWIVDFYTGSPSDASYMQFRKDLHGKYGRAASPIHGIEGRYQFGGATIQGWTWIGFASKDDLEDFLKEFKSEPAL